MKKLSNLVLLGALGLGSGSCLGDYSTIDEYDFNGDGMRDFVVYDGFKGGCYVFIYQMDGHYMKSNVKCKNLEPIPEDKIETVKLVKR